MSSLTLCTPLQAWRYPRALDKPNASDGLRCVRALPKPERGPSGYRRHDRVLVGPSVSARDVAPYVLAQCAGATAAALTLVHVAC